MSYDIEKLFEFPECLSARVGGGCETRRAGRWRTKRAGHAKNIVCSDAKYSNLLRAADTCSAVATAEDARGAHSGRGRRNGKRCGSDLYATTDADETRHDSAAQSRQQYGNVERPRDAIEEAKVEAVGLSEMGHEDDTKAVGLGRYPSAIVCEDAILAEAPEEKEGEERRSKRRGSRERKRQRKRKEVQAGRQASTSQEGHAKPPEVGQVVKPEVGQVLKPPQVGQVVHDKPPEVGQVAKPPEVGHAFVKPPEVGQVFVPPEVGQVLRPQEMGQVAEKPPEVGQVVDKPAEVRHVQKPSEVGQVSAKPLLKPIELHAPQLVSLPNLDFATIEPFPASMVASRENVWLSLASNLLWRHKHETRDEARKLSVKLEFGSLRHITSIQAAMNLAHFQLVRGLVSERKAKEFVRLTAQCHYDYLKVISAA